MYIVDTTCRYNKTFISINSMKGEIIKLAWAGFHPHSLFLCCYKVVVVVVVAVVIVVAIVVVVVDVVVVVVVVVIGYCCVVAVLECG